MVLSLEFGLPEAGVTVTPRTARAEATELVVRDTGEPCLCPCPVIELRSMDWGGTVVDEIRTVGGLLGDCSALVGQTLSVMAFPRRTLFKLPFEPPMDTDPPMAFTRFRSKGRFKGWACAGCDSCCCC